MVDDLENWRFLDDIRMKRIIGDENTSASTVDKGILIFGRKLINCIK